MLGRTVRIRHGEYNRPMLEIERKFLVSTEKFKEDAHSVTRIVQGFLNTQPERTVRIRIREGQGFITVKGKSNEEGTSRFEWEMEIPIVDAEALLKLCEEEVIDKIRYEVKAGDHIYEVDEFFRNNKGLIIAEIELKSELEKFPKPAWLGKEVTGKREYFNSQLSKHPYKNWNE